MKSLFYFSPKFKDHISEVHGEKGLVWLAKLPELVRDYERRWDMHFVGPVANLSYAYVAMVEYAGKQAILKMNPDFRIIQKETQWLSAYSDFTPKILEDASSEGVFLMERIEPGLPLKHLVEAGRDDLATRTICEMVKHLQTSPLRSDDRFQHLSELKHIALLRGHFDKYLVEKAESLFSELTVKSSNDVVLHGDLHHDNIISDGMGWKVIDPHAYVGDPVSEISPFIYNPLDVLPAWKNLESVLQRRLDILLEEMPYDEQRIRSWAFCRVMLSMAWTFEETERVPEFESRVARFLSSLV